jgi:hypothetical protein
MARALELTSWLGVSISHPGEWELAIASGPDEPGRCTFTDRHYHRLNIQWRKVKQPPKLELLLEKYRQSDKGQLRELSPLGNLPAGWVGLLRKAAEEGVVTYATKVFTLCEPLLLAEVTLVWPKEQQRDAALEAAILKSVAAESSAWPRLWQAMGLSLDLPRPFDLRRNDSKVGRVSWEFAAPGHTIPPFVVQRLALPEYWIKGSLMDWMKKQVPAGHKAVKEEAAVVNGHPAWRLISRGRADLWSSLRGRRLLRLDLAWLCPQESRVYHLITHRTSRTEEPALPEGLVIRCCRPVPQVRPGKVRKA